MRARGATSRRFESAVTLAALRSSAVPMVHIFSTDPKHGAVRIVGGGLQVEETRDMREEFRAPT